ncbi:MAG: hypothetical protein V3V78_02330 [Candidatus Woesearchaeota archaeon]
MITATLDVNCINLNPHDYLDKIHSLNDSGKIKLYKTDTLDLELIYGNPHKSNKERIVITKNLDEDKGAFVLGHSRLGHAKLGSDKSHEEQRLIKSKKLEEDQGVGLWGHTRWNHGKYGTKEDTYIDEFKSFLFPDYDYMKETNQRKAIRDCIHLSTHKVNGRDFFITIDNHFLKNKEELKEKWNIQVISPDEFLNLPEIEKLLKK